MKHRKARRRSIQSNAMKRLLLSILSIGTCLISAAEKPNIVYIMADELGYFETGYMGNPNIETPNLDRMAAEVHELHPCPSGFVGLCPDALLLDDRKTQWAHLGSIQWRGNSFARGGGNGGFYAQAAWIRHRSDSESGDAVAADPPECRRNMDSMSSSDTMIKCTPSRIIRATLCATVRKCRREKRMCEQGETYSHYVILEGGHQVIRQPNDQPF